MCLCWACSYDLCLWWQNSSRKTAAQLQPVVTLGLCGSSLDCPAPFGLLPCLIREDQETKRCQLRCHCSGQAALRDHLALPKQQPSLRRASDDANKERTDPAAFLSSWSFRDLLDRLRGRGPIATVCPSGDEEKIDDYRAGSGGLTPFRKELQASNWPSPSHSHAMAGRSNHCSPSICELKLGWYNAAVDQKDCRHES